MRRKEGSEQAGPLTACEKSIPTKNHGKITGKRKEEIIWQK
ncbi:hypothetical protein CLOLEP_01223 [[Clostridium] leptum DSM 753]|uniref:Uncharacterized protein n=1 Tax=[Clostridium] leptum DSM 753 TaxID=428125 RepID=A7VRN9_9FIRM|nr:hypothetical protein CLOLEP_01223 [[Clostridium] leptum DSM 753]